MSSHSFDPSMIVRTFRLRSEQVCARHAHHSRVNASCREPFATFQRQMDF
jgi:hypothetical protein